MDFYRLSKNISKEQKTRIFDRYQKIELHIHCLLLKNFTCFKILNEWANLHLLDYFYLKNELSYIIKILSSQKKKAFLKFESI